MLIPKTAWSVHKAACTDTVRYQLCGVHFEKKGRWNHATATDGKILLRNSWKQYSPEEDFPATNGNIHGTPEDFSTIIPSAVCKEAFKHCPTRQNKPILENVLLSSNHGLEKLTLHATDLDTNWSVEAQPIQGQFPDCKSILESCSEREHSRTIDPFRLLQILQAVIAASGLKDKKNRDNSSPVITLKWSDKRAEPITMEYESADGEHQVTGLIMSLVTK